MSEQKGICHVAFSGGLDSTWILHDLLKKGEIVKVVQINTAPGSQQLILETLVRREMLNFFHKHFPGQIVDEILFPFVSQSLNFRTGIDWKTGKRVGALRNTLIQQISVRNALLSCVSQSDPTVDRYFVGWHKDDIETTFSKEKYDYLCDLTSLVQMTEAHWIYQEWFPKDLSVQIEMPCWDLGKLDMWNDLPNEIQSVVILGGSHHVRYDQEMALLVADLSHHTKFSEYVELGLTPSNTLTFSHVSSIVDMLYIYLSSSGID